MTCQIFSFGWRSGLQIGHSSTGTHLLWRHAVVLDAIKGFGLSCRNMQAFSDEDIWARAYVLLKLLIPFRIDGAFQDKQPSNSIGIMHLHIFRCWCYELYLMRYSKFSQCYVNEHHMIIVWQFVDTYFKFLKISASFFLSYHVTDLLPVNLISSKTFIWLFLCSDAYCILFFFSLFPNVFIIVVVLLQVWILFFWPIEFL